MALRTDEEKGMRGKLRQCQCCQLLAEDGGWTEGSRRNEGKICTGCLKIFQKNTRSDITSLESLRLRKLLD